MKYILIIIFLMSAICSQGQLSTNQYKQVTGMIKTATDKLYKEINWLRAGKTADSLNIVFLTNVNNQLSSAVVKSFEIHSQQSVTNKALMDSIAVLRKMIPDFLKVDTTGFLRVYDNTLFSKEIK